MSYSSNTPMSAGRRAALEVLGVLPRPGAATTALAAGAPPQSGAPAAVETIDWDAVVAIENARLGLQTPSGGTQVATAEPRERPDQRAAAIDWSSVVDAVNTEEGFSRRGANIDPRFAAYLTNGVA